MSGRSLCYSVHEKCDSDREDVQEAEIWAINSPGNGAKERFSEGKGGMSGESVSPFAQ
jgi:hypothetical protein